MKTKAGSVTIDFVFGITITVGVSFILLALCFTMAMVEVSQYIAFASSRSYFSGHLSEEEQEDRGKAKFEKLMTLRPFKGMLKDSGWFSLAFLGSTDFRDQYPNVQLAHDSDTFFGTQLKFKADVLELKIPFLDRPYGNYDATVASYLGREPSTKECLDFERARWTKFQEVTGFPPPPGTNPANDYAVVTDNGC